MKRFFWVSGPSSRRSHMVPAPAKRKNPVEGDLTFCGIPIGLGWRNLFKIFGGRGPYPVCARCESRMPSNINVARVRG